MSERQKSQKGFVAVTLITLLAIATVIVVYAALLGTFTGQNVTVVAVKGTVEYSQDNSSGWATSLIDVPINGSWYARFTTDPGGYTGNVIITWDLYNTTLVYTVTTTSFYLDGTAQNIYASSNGLQSTNYNWDLKTTAAGNYYIKVTIQTAT
jgi:hypothetical protein